MEANNNIQVVTAILENCSCVWTMECSSLTSWDLFYILSNKPLLSLLLPLQNITTEHKEMLLYYFPMLIWVFRIKQSF